MKIEEETSEQMVLGAEAFDCGIQKRLVHAGKHQVNYVNGTKVSSIECSRIFWNFLRNDSKWKFWKIFIFAF